MAASRVSPEDLAVVANNFATVYGNCINHSMQLAGATKVRVCLILILNHSLNVVFKPCFRSNVLKFVCIERAFGFHYGLRSSVNMKMI